MNIFWQDPSHPTLEATHESLECHLARQRWRTQSSRRRPYSSVLVALQWQAVGNSDVGGKTRTNADFVLINDRCQTSCIYILRHWWCNSWPMPSTQSVCTKGHAAGRSDCGHRWTSYHGVPSIAYTFPDVSLGLVWPQPRRKKPDIAVKTLFSLECQRRAMRVWRDSGQNQKLIYDETTERVLRRWHRWLSCRRITWETDLAMRIGATLEDIALTISMPISKSFKWTVA